MLHAIWTDLLGFAGVEMHRRILGLAHNADFETIADTDIRARCEAKALKFGRHLAVNRRQIHSIDEVNTLAALIEREGIIEGRRPPLSHHLAERRRRGRSRSSTSAGCPMTSASSRSAPSPDIATAIRDMWVRGAPLIGVTAAYGVAIAMASDPSDAALDAAWETLHATRPTAINLRWALDEMRALPRRCLPKQRAEAAYGRAAEIADEDVALNRAIGAARP